MAVQGAEDFQEVASAAEDVAPVADSQAEEAASEEAHSVVVTDPRAALVQDLITDITTIITTDPISARGITDRFTAATAQAWDVHHL